MTLSIFACLVAVQKKNKKMTSFANTSEQRYSLIQIVKQIIYSWTNNLRNDLRKKQGVGTEAATSGVL